MQLGEIIKQIRKKKGLKQGEFAEQLGIKQNYLSLIEKGKRLPSHSLIEKICNAFEIPVPALFMLAMEEKDIPEKKRESYKHIYPAFEALIKQSFFD